MILFFSGGAWRALDPVARAPSGGAELQVALLAKELAARGLAVAVASADGDFADGVEWSGVRMRACGRFDTGRLGDALAALPRVLRTLRMEKPAHVVVYGWTSWLAILAALRPFFGYRLAYVCALDGEIDGRFERQNPVRGRLFLWGVRAADARLAITEAQAARFRERGMNSSVARLLLATDRKRGPLPAKTVDLLWVARCNGVKRPELFLELAQRLPRARCRMLCSPQDPDLFARIQARAAGLTNVDFSEGVPYASVQAEFDRARVFVNTSNDEGVPNTFLHAALGGAPIASLIADPDGLIRRFGAGVSAAGDFEALERGIRVLLDNQAALAAAAAGAGRFLDEWHDNARNVAAFLEGLSG